MLKIGFDAKRLFNNFTGLGNYSRDLVHNLNQFYPKNEYHLYTPKINLNHRTQSFRDKSNIEIHQPNFPILKSYWRTSGMKNRFQTDGIDVFHGLSHELPIGVQKIKVKSIVTIHDLIFKHYPKHFPWIDRKIYDWKFRYACEHSDRIIAISESTKKDIVEWYGISEEKIEVVYQTCHSIFQSNQEIIESQIFTGNDFEIPSDFLLYVGSIIPRKNLLRCIQAIERLPSDLKLPLLIVGDGKRYKEEVLKYIRKKKIEKWVVFCPKVNLTELKYLYQKARIVLYPSLNEGFGLPIIESLFSKTPVITSNISSLPEAAGGGGIHVNPNSVEEIKYGIEDLLTNTKLYNEKVKNGLEHVHKFRKEKVTSEVMSIYRSLFS